MIQDDAFIADRAAGCFEFPNRSDYSLIGQITVGIVVLSNEEYTRMVSTGSKNQLMKVVEVVVIRGENNAILANGVTKLNRISPTPQA